MRIKRSLIGTWEPPVTPHRPQPRLVVSDPDVTSGQRFPLLCVLPITGMDAIEEGLAPPSVTRQSSQEHSLPPLRLLQLRPRQSHHPNQDPESHSWQFHLHSLQSPQPGRGESEGEVGVWAVPVMRTDVELDRGVRGWGTCSIRSRPVARLKPAPRGAGGRKEPDEEPARQSERTPEDAGEDTGILPNSGDDLCDQLRGPPTSGTVSMRSCA